MSTAFVFNSRNGALSRWESVPGNEVVQALGTVFVTGGPVSVADPATSPDAYIDSGQLDFGSPELKNVRSAYMGAALENPVEIEVRAVDQTHTYQTLTNSDSILREHRVIFGRGLNARFWAVKIMSTGRTLLRDFGLLPHVKERRL